MGRSCFHQHYKADVPWRQALRLKGVEGAAPKLSQRRAIYKTRRIAGGREIMANHGRTTSKMLPPMQHPRILDVGCGEGGPTLELARLANGKVIGMDSDHSALYRLSKRIEAAGLSQRVHLAQGSIRGMPFSEERFDLLWSEGTIHFMGFAASLAAWRRLIKPRGFLVVHEGTFPEPEAPCELEAYWKGSYANVEPAAAYMAALRAHGFALLGHFTLPQEVWWIEYYQPLEERLRVLRAKYAGDRAALGVLDRHAQEVELFVKYPTWHGSAFFVMKKMG